MSRIRIGDETKVACLCPTARKKGDCFHEKFMLEYGERIWAMDEDASDGERMTVFKARVTAQAYGIERRW